MKKIIRLTESDLVRLVKRVINENESLDEQPSLIKNLFSAGAKSSKTVAKQGIPLMSQISHEAQLIIKQLPTNAKVGPKLVGLFGKHGTRIKSLQSQLSKMPDQTLGIYIKRLSDTVSKTKGTPVNPQQMYMDAVFLKKELENIKSSLSKPKQGGVLNKNVNYDKQMEGWYNALYTEIGSLSSFIADLEALLKPI
jgi:hypothetical protein